MRNIEQLCKKEETAKHVLASKSGVTLQVIKSNDDDAKQGTARGPKRQCLCGSAIYVDNALEAFGSTIEKSEAARMELEQHILSFEERIYQDLPTERASRTTGSGGTSRTT